MLIRNTCLIIALVVFPSLSQGQIDPDPDGLGIYFDLGARKVSSIVSSANTPVTAYVILSNPTLEGQLIHWEAIASTSGVAAVSGYPTYGTNMTYNMPGGVSTWVLNVVCGIDSPPLNQGINVLAELEIWVFDPSGPIELKLSPYGEIGSPAYYIRDGGGWATCNSPVGDWGLPLAVINGAPPVRGERTAWDNVKATYRR